MKILKKVVSSICMILSFIAPQFKKEDSKTGVKETKEMFVAVNEIALLLCKQFSDGVQITDFEKFYSELTTNEEFKNKIKDGYDKANLIPSEFKDIDLGEGLEVVSVQLEYVPKIVDCFVKEESEITA